MRSANQPSRPGVIGYFATSGAAVVATPSPIAAAARLRASFCRAVMARSFLGWSDNRHGTDGRGGEPTLLSLGFFEQAVGLPAKHAEPADTPERRGPGV
jgi:hypothetical protein